MEVTRGGCGKSGDPGGTVPVGCRDCDRGRSQEMACEAEREPLRVGACRDGSPRNAPSGGTLGNQAAEIRWTQEISPIKGSRLNTGRLGVALHKTGDEAGEIRTTGTTMEVI